MHLDIVNHTFQGWRHVFAPQVGGDRRQIPEQRKQAWRSADNSRTEGHGGRERIFGQETGGKSTLRSVICSFTVSQVYCAIPQLWILLHKTRYPTGARSCYILLRLAVSQDWRDLLQDRQPCWKDQLNPALNTGTTAFSTKCFPKTMLLDVWHPCFLYLSDLDCNKITLAPAIFTADVLVFSTENLPYALKLKTF